MSKKGSVESPKRRRDEGRLKGWEEKHNENHQSQWVGKINRFSDQQIFNKMLGFFLNNCQTFLIHTFLVADKRLYKRLCPSVRRLVGRSVREHESKSGENMHFRPCPPVRDWYWPCIRLCSFNKNISPPNDFCVWAFQLVALPVFFTIRGGGAHPIAWLVPLSTTGYQQSYCDQTSPKSVWINSKFCIRTNILNHYSRL